MRDAAIAEEVGILNFEDQVGGVVPVSFETTITELGQLQLWCVANDGRRWKLEFNVRERIPATA